MKLIRSANESYPVVKVTDAAMKSMHSDITVDLDGLNELLRDDLGLESPVAPQFTLYGRSRYSLLKGFHLHSSSTAYLHVPSIARIQESNDYSLRRGTAQVLVHEANHLVDSLDHPSRTLGETAMRVAWGGVSGLVGVEVANQIDGIGGAPLGIGAALVAQRVYYDYLDKGEIRAREAHHNAELVEKYERVVRFPAIPWG